MKIISFLESAGFMLLVFMIFFVAKSVFPNENTSTLASASMVRDISPEEAKSPIWFVNHPDEARKQIQACRKDINLSNNQNCINAEYTAKLIGQ